MEHEQLFSGHQTYARYLHVAEAVVENEVQAAWDGLGGRLKALRREVVDVKADVKAGQAQTDADMEEVKARQSVAKADMEEMKADIMEEVKAGQAEVKAEMADMKALLEKLVAQSLQNAA